MVAYEVGYWLIRFVFYEVGIGIGIGYLSDDLCWLMRMDLAYEVAGCMFRIAAFILNE